MHKRRTLRVFKPSNYYLKHPGWDVLTLFTHQYTQPLGVKQGTNFIFHTEDLTNGLIVDSIGRGMRVDSANDAYVPVNAVGSGTYWHAATTSVVYVIDHIVNRSDGSNGTLMDEGGSANGMHIYRNGNTNKQIVFSTAQSSTRVSITSTSTYDVGDKCCIVAKYDAGAMSLWINGKSEGTASNGSSIPAHGNVMCIGCTADNSGTNAGTTNNATQTVAYSGNGSYHLFAVIKDRNIPSDELCRRISLNPYRHMLQPQMNILFPELNGIVPPSAYYSLPVNIVRTQNV